MTRRLSFGTYQSELQKTATCRFHLYRHNNWRDRHASHKQKNSKHGKYISSPVFSGILLTAGGSVAEWLACWTQAQKGPGSNRSRDAVG